MTRTHVRLLGPCFKTGRRGHRPTRNRDATSASKGHSLYEAAPLPAGRAAQNAALSPEAELRPRLRYATSSTLREAPEKCNPTRGGKTPGPARKRVGDRTHRPPGSLNLRRRLRETPPFTTTQFHVLLNSLFKVLFNFPSRYLFAIGLGVIFSLTWSLPRTLSCTPKQLDSGEAAARGSFGFTGLSPSAGYGPCHG